MSYEIEELQAPTPRAMFAFWGQHARLMLPTGHVEVLFDYLTEPPHGDPLYSLKVNGYTLGGWKTPLPCFGRSLHLSPCSRYLALTALRGGRSSFHVVDLLGERLWSRDGFVELDGVTSNEVRFFSLAYDGGNLRRRLLDRAPFEDDQEWKRFIDGVP